MCIFLKAFELASLNDCGTSIDALLDLRGESLSLLSGEGAETRFTEGFLGDGAEEHEADLVRPLSIMMKEVRAAEETRRLRHKKTE